jgi:hypothetical protein
MTEAPNMNTCASLVRGKLVRIGSVIDSLDGSDSVAAKTGHAYLVMPHYEKIYKILGDAFRS